MAEENKKGKYTGINARISEELDRQRNAASEIAAEFDVPAKQIEERISQRSGYKGKRGPTTFNAFQKLYALHKNSGTFFLYVLCRSSINFVFRARDWREIELAADSNAATRQEKWIQGIHGVT